MTAQSPRHSVSVAAAVVNDEGKALAIKRRDNAKWEPPGGVLELHEPILDGLVREVEEETGLRVVPGPLSGVYKNMELGIVALVFRCAPGLGEIAATTESRELKWLALDEISQYMDEAYAIRMFDALEGDAPRVRTHNGVNLLDSTQGRPAFRQQSR